MKLDGEKTIGNIYYIRFMLVYGNNLMKDLQATFKNFTPEG